MKLTDPFISIVIPSYNRASFLEKNIPKLLALEYDNYEIIVVDDGSNDNTSQVFERITSTKLHYYYKTNEERAAARNYGVDKANGTYITFLDSDDILYPDSLRNMANALAEKDYPDFMHMGYEIGTPDAISRTIRGLKDSDPFILVKGNPLSCMGIVVKRTVFLQHRFNEDRKLSASEDWELWMRIVAHHGIRTDDRVIGKLIEHDSRSVMSVPEEKLVDRKNLAIQYAFADTKVQQVYGPYKKTIEAHWETYVALHLAIEGNKKRAVYYCKEAIKKDINSLLTKRGLVILKLLLVK